MGVGVSVDLRFPREDRLPPFGPGAYVAPLRDLDPLLAQRGRPWPCWDDVFGPRRRGEVREVRQHDHRDRRTSTAPAPYYHPCARSEVGPDEVGVVDRQSRRGRPQIDKGLYVGVDPPPYRAEIAVGFVVPRVSVTGIR